LELPDENRQNAASIFSGFESPEWIERMYKYFAEINNSPVVCHWKYRLSEIEPEEAIGLAN
jgi:uncharacterized membrane protein YfhO